MENPLLKEYYEENKRFIPVFNDFENHAIKIRPTTLKKYLNLYLCYFGTKFDKKLGEFCYFLQKHGYNYTTCNLRDMLVDRTNELYKEPFGNLLLLNKTHFLSNIDSMSGNIFQNFITWMFEKIGYNVTQNKTSHDQGADLIIQQNQDRIAIQTKRWNKKIPNKAIQAVYSGKTYYECTDALVISNSYYTKSAKELARACNVTLWKREDLFDFFQRNKLQIINFL